MEVTFGEAAFKLLKDQLIPEIGEVKQAVLGLARAQEATVARLERMELESARRFELIDKRFEQMDRRFEQMDRRFEQMDRRFEQMDQRFGQMDQRFEQMDQRLDLIDKRFEQIDRRFAEGDMRAGEHARRMDLLDKRLERMESHVSEMRDDIHALKVAVSRLSLLGEYVRRIDEVAAEVRELRRRQEEFERRITNEVLPRLPKVGT